MANKTKPSQEKYYTPTFEEFYPGFEFEVKVENDTWSKFKWTEYSSFGLTHKSSNEVWTLFGKFEDGSVRVKYLDREDIEDVLKNYGWDVLDDYYSNGGFKNNFLSQCEVKVEAHHPGYPMLFIYKKDGRWTVELDENRRFHEISIKNKSELKKVMQMVGIGGENE